MAKSPIVSALPAYVDQQRDLLTSSSVLGAESAQLFTLQPGVKSSAAVNLFDTEVVLQDGSDCGWNEQGTVTLSQRIITTGQVKVNMAFCYKKFIGKYTEHQVRVAAGQESLPFEEKFTSSIVEKINTAVEKVIWQGDTTSTDTTLQRFDGILKILAAESTVITVAETASATKFDIVKDTLLAIPARVLKSDTMIFCGPEFLRAYGQEMVEKNLYHFEPGKDYDEIAIPGSNIHLKALGGLADTNKLVAGRLSNFFYGCDMLGDKEEFKLWFSDDNDEFRLAVLFNAGVQVAFPDEVVLTTIATA